jgi:hypothetical protein
MNASHSGHSGHSGHDGNGIRLLLCPAVLAVRGALLDQPKTSAFVSALAMPIKAAPVMRPAQIGSMPSTHVR